MLHNKSLETKSFFVDLKLKSTSTEGLLSVRVADLCQVVQHRVKRCPSFGHLLRDAILKSVDNKLTLLMYHDQVVPGNVLQINPERKSTLIYCSFKELGHWLCKSFSWMTVGVVTDSTLSKVADGMTAVIRHLIKLFVEPGGLLHSGITFSLQEAVWLLEIRDIALIADEAALKATWSNKGASGLRPCLLCQNILRTDADVPPPFLHISEGNYMDFQLQSDSDVFLLADNLAAMKARGVTAVSFNQTQKHSGLTYAPEGLLWDVTVRGWLGPTCANFDPTHIYFSNGIFGSETQLLFDEIERMSKKNQCVISSRHFIDFVSSSWATPSLPSCLHSNISERQKAASLVLKDRGTASQQLSMFPLLDCFVRTSLLSHPALKLKVDSFLQLCSVIRAVRRAKEIPLQSDETILELQRRYMQLFIAAWGRDKVRPKHHYQFHLGQQACRWGAMFDCWCTERKHRDFKKVATLIAGNERFELEALAKLIQHEEQLMVEEGYHDGLCSNQVLISSGKVFHIGTCLLFLNGRPAAFLVKGFLSKGAPVEVFGELWQLEPVAAQ
jgi:hypothetical protein